MDSVAASAQQLKETLERVGINATFSPREDLGATLTGLPTSPEVIALYTSYAPIAVSLPFAPERLLLYSPDALIERQLGYRWLETGRGEPGTWPILNGWEASWLAIGDSSADPVIAHTSEPGTPISLAVHGAGRWAPILLASSLADFLWGLSTWLDVLIGQFEGGMLDEAKRRRGSGARPSSTSTRRPRPVLDHAPPASWRDSRCTRRSHSTSGQRSSITLPPERRCRAGR